jgi:hypothetical protein
MPSEPRSSCDHCAMEPGRADLPPEGPFHPEMHCCTYHPHLAPHAVGAILSSGSEHAKAYVRARLAGRVAVTPAGLGAPPDYSDTYEAKGGRDVGFGRNLELRCPMQEGSRCGVWENRGVACATFHCKYERGASGAGMWNLVIVALTAIERALAGWLIARQGLDAIDTDRLLQDPRSEALDAQAWGAWRGREEEYFLEAHQLVSQLQWSDVAELGKAQLNGLDAALRGAFENFHTAWPLPGQVQRNGVVLIQLGTGDKAHLQNPWINNDRLEIPEETARALLQFSSGPLEKIGSPASDEALLRKLLDWQVLVPGDPGTGA